MATAFPSLSSYGLNPGAQFGAGTYGAVPGPIGTPPSVFSQVSDVIPQLSSLTGQTGTVIGSELAGQVPTDVQNQIKNAAATWGIQSGMPGSGAADNFSLESLGLTSLQEQQAGLGNYLKTLTGVGSTMLQPSLVADIAARNATMAAAPNPAMAAQKLISLMQGNAGPRQVTQLGLGPGFGPGTKSLTNPLLAGVGTLGNPFAAGGGGFADDAAYYGSSPGLGGTAGVPGTTSPTYTGTGAFNTSSPTAQASAQDIYYQLGMMGLSPDMSGASTTGTSPDMTGVDTSNLSAGD